MKAKVLKSLLSAIPDNVSIGFHFESEKEALQTFKEWEEYKKEEPYAGIMSDIRRVEWVGIGHGEDEQLMIFLEPEIL